MVTDRRRRTPDHGYTTRCVRKVGYVRETCVENASCLAKRYCFFTRTMKSSGIFSFLLDYVCSTVSSILSGLETRSPGLNTLGTT